MAISVSTVSNFDAFEYVKESKKLGINEEFAELQAKKFLEFSKTIHDQQIEIEALRENEPVSKKDLEIVKLELQKEIKSLEVKLLFVYGTGFIALLGVLAKGFHWL